MNAATDYDVRSLQHERRMLELYRRGAAGDGALLQPLANACWRAAAFEWQLHEDVAAVRILWEEAARALAEGFVRKRAGFEQSAEQLILGLHFSIAAQTADVARSLVHATAARPSTGNTARFPRPSLLLIEAYQWVVRALIERNSEHACAAQNSLAAARVESDRYSRQTAWAGEAAWRAEEHEATRALLYVIACVLETTTAPRVAVRLLDWTAATKEFASLMDAALLSLDRFSETEENHRPKLYCWLPGIALSIAAAGAGLSLDWLDVRHQTKQHGYSRLPARFVQQADTLRAQASYT